MDNFAKELLEDAGAIQGELVAWRRELHRHPELGLDLPFTKKFVKGKLVEFGYEPKDCGRSGVVALAGRGGGKCFLIRGDMDALPIGEEADVDYRSENEGRMHACGHDLHTAMLLGAAKLLKKREGQLAGAVKLMFQPGEETCSGAADMIEHGVLENPRVDAAAMIHVATGFPIPSGTLLMIAGGAGAYSSDTYQITVQGKGGHGAMPQLSVDPINAAAHIHLALQEINSREVPPGEYGIVTIGYFRAGDAPNVIPDKAVLQGTIRTADKGIQSMIKGRLKEICEATARAFRCEASVEFTTYCPAMIADREVAACAEKYMPELLGPQGALPMAAVGGGKMGGGSEDFAFVTEKVPGTGFFLGAGSSKEGYAYPQHHPMAKFDDSVLFKGSAAYAHMAARWLQDHR